MDSSVHEGADYFHACARADGEGTDTARAFLNGIREVPAGRCGSFELEYPCHSPDKRRWFLGKLASEKNKKLIEIARIILTAEED